MLQKFLGMHSVSAEQSMMPQVRSFIPLVGILALHEEFSGIYTAEALGTYRCIDVQAVHSKFGREKLYQLTGLCCFFRASLNKLSKAGSDCATAKLCQQSKSPMHDLSSRYAIANLAA